MNKNNVCITGLPRSGTTLTCTLMNRLPGVIALHEPMKTNRFSKYPNREAIFEAIIDFFNETRSSIERDRVFVAKKAIYGRKGSRKYPVKKELPPDFMLCIKQPAAFTALLDGLVERFACFAVIRNPLAILASWNRVDMPVKDGHSPAAEKLDRKLAKRLARIEDKLDRQIALLSWYYEQYTRFLPKSNILPYEHIIDSGGTGLSALCKDAVRLPEILQKQNIILQNRNRNPKYDRVLMQELGEKLLQTDGAFWQFYSKASVEALLNTELPGETIEE